MLHIKLKRKIDVVYDDLTFINCFIIISLLAAAEVEINKLKSEEAGLRDSLLKMQALNEGLGQDKIELSKLVMQLEQGNAALEVSL